MKIALFSIPEINPGKHNIKDSRLDQINKLTKSKKKTYCPVEVVGDSLLQEADAILTLSEFRTDLILRDLEFVETRLPKDIPEDELLVLGKLKDVLEKEELISSVELSEVEKKAISGFGLSTNKPVVIVTKEELNDINGVLIKSIRQSGYINFFTTGEKETRSWMIKKGASAWGAAGEIHSDIQKGFIRAEIISFDDFIQAQGETQAKQAGKMRLEQKDYLMQDADIAVFRFSK
ncbi:MAG: DUF933 domain-containing protein [Candidatus Omnitrophica bacterium]|nr:DUF933 domain-containing protein [Candidatus Omnitrophota bacterium]